MTTESPAKPYTCDVVIIGSGIAGLWLANRLRREGYNLVVIENAVMGGVQTLASQGMIHGGQKYALTGAVTKTASSAAAMPQRWEACLGGWGEVDLTGVKNLSDKQVMWPAGGVVADAAVFAAAQAVNTGTARLEPEDFPPVFAHMRAEKKFKGRVYELPEKVMDTKSLVHALAAPLKDRILQGVVEEVQPDGQVAVSGQVIQAKVVIFAAGKGNEQAFDLLKIKGKHSQRRPLRQVMVKPVPYALYGHGIVADPKPRVTVTSHPLSDGSYVWYLGGGIAEKGAFMSEKETILFARKEMEDMFPLINWDNMEWATWAGDRAEPFDESGQLPPGPHIHQRGQVLIAWPSKLTFTPALSDQVLEWLKSREIAPAGKSTPPPPLPAAKPGAYPWETANWNDITQWQKAA